MVLKDPECRAWEWSPMDECCRREIIYIRYVEAGAHN